MSNNIAFETSDTPLATWLIINQVRLLEIKKNNSLSVFILDNSEPGKLAELCFKWESGTAEGNCSVFHKTYRNLVHKVTRGA